MPVYEFRCKECEANFDKIQSMNDEHICDCPECGSSNTKRIYSIPLTKFISDSELSQRLSGVPKSRIDRSMELREDRKKRKNDPKSEKDIVSNELHVQ